MRITALLSLLLLVTLSACEQNRDVTTVVTTYPESIFLTEIEESGWVYGYPGDMGKYGFSDIHNATAQLIYDGEVLDEINTDGTGEYSFSPQIIPEGAYVLLTAPGYYPNARKVNPELPIDYFNLIPRYFGGFSGSGLHENMEVVRIRGSLQEDNEGASGFFYFLNENQELIGNFTSDATLEFDITTAANTAIYLYHQNGPNCPPNGPIALGSFSEDTHLGHIYDQNNDAFKQKYITVNGKAKTCDNTPLPAGDGYYLVKYGNTTISHLQDHITDALSDRLFYADKCELESASEIIITAVNRAESLFGEYTLLYSGEDYIEDIDIPTCLVDDTFFEFLVGGEEINVDNFTTANVTPDGRIVIKQITLSAHPTDVNIGLELRTNGNPDTYEGKLSVYLNGAQTGVIIGAEDLLVNIISNDGEYLEGSFSGQVADAYEMPIGSFEGSFKARIQ